MRIRFLILFHLLLAVFLLTHCKKSNTGSSNSSGGGGGTGIGNIAGNYDIYVAGEYWPLTGTLSGRAVYWKNGVINYLPRNVNGSSANCIFVSNGDVYVGGLSGDSAKIWKNGVEIFSAFSINGVNSIYVSGSDVYAVGEFSIPGYPYGAMLWKNGVLQPFPYAIWAWSVFVQGSDVYVAGGTDTSRAGRMAILWKNGVATGLTSSQVPSEAYRVFVSGNDVYVIGMDKDPSGKKNSVIWKNGVRSVINDGLTYDVCEGLAISGNDVHICGSEVISGYLYGIKYWKNGVLTEFAPRNQRAAAHALKVVDGNVFIGGGISNMTTYLTTLYVWVNGNPITIAEGRGLTSIRDIFISRR